MKLQQLRIDKIIKPPRSSYIKHIKYLASKIKKYGLIHPIIVTRVGNRYSIVDGELRYHACRRLKLQRIAALCITSSEVVSYYYKSYTPSDNSYMAAMALEAWRNYWWVGAALHKERNII